MGRILGIALCGCALMTGCQLPGDRARCGFTFSIVKPPTVNTESPVLIQTGAPIVGAHPMGNVAGPVQEGQFLHGPAMPPATVPQVPKTMLRMPIGGIHAPCKEGGYLTVEEWCAIQRATNATPPAMPK